MSASRFVGRVGGLAVALGVGAAVFSGYGVAWADGTGTGAGPSSTGSPAAGEASAGSSAGSESKGSADGTGASGRAATSPSGEAVSTGGARSSARSKGHSRADVARSRVLSTPASTGGPVDSVAAAVTRAGSTGPSTFAAPAASAGGQSPANNSSAPAPLATAVAVSSVAKSAPPPAAAVSGFLTTVANDLLKPFSGSNPVVPVDSPLALALVAFTRREAANAAAISSTPSALTTTSLLASSGIIVSQSVSYDGKGILRGDIVASSTLPLTYTVIGAPSLGGKLYLEKLASGAGTGKFSYLPDASALTPGTTENFRILVAETTQFDQFLLGIPLLGGLVTPVLNVLYQVPIVNDLLAPIIGRAEVADFTVNPLAETQGKPVAFTYKMPSFDGALISLNYFPAIDVATGALTSAPTILSGPGLAAPGQTDPDAKWSTNLVGLTPGVGPVRSNGYNIITWDPRGEFASGGILQLDSPAFEGRDVSSMISWATSAQNPAQSQVKMESANDPLLGMIGGSYGGGIQLGAAGSDSRIDAIVPGISWNSLNDSLYPNSAFKTSYASLLLLSLVTTGARINNQIYLGIISGDLLGVISQTAQAVLASSGPDYLIGNISAPVLYIQGTVDVLFPLQQAINNAAMMTPGVPAKMIWYCGGHGVCLTDQEAGINSTGDRNLNATFKWLDNYVKGVPTPTGPVFQFVDQNGTWWEDATLPSVGDPYTGTGFYGTPYSALSGQSGGILPIFPIIGGSGPAPQATLPYSLGLASEASNAITVDIPSTTTETNLVGAPKLTFDYTGLGTNRFVYAQIVDNTTGLVVGNLVTPVAVTMDGQQHTATVNMENIAYTMDHSSDLSLQITSSATAYESFLSVGVINISNIALTMPTAANAQLQPV